MNIVYSSDDNYAQHLAVSILSLLKNNEDIEEINIFVISNKIQIKSKNRIEKIVENYKRRLYWVDFEPYSKELVLDMEWEIAISSYARLFLEKMLPEWCEKVIYLDCDTVVCESLERLWKTPMEGYAVVGVKDIISDDFKYRIGLKADDVYINAGVMLINIEYWRRQKILSYFMNFIVARKGRVTHHDQGVINGVLSNYIKIVEPCYNSMTPFFTNKYSDLICFYKLKNYYTKEQIKEAVEHPIVIHYTPAFVGRVWEKGCKHPRAKEYLNYLEETEWRDNLIDAPKVPLKLQILFWMYGHIPIRLLEIMLQFRRKK